MLIMLTPVLENGTEEAEQVAQNAKKIREETKNNIAALEKRGKLIASRQLEL